MTEIHLRLIREFPKSPSSAEAYRSAADQLCADRRYREANRLYDYIRATFGKTPTAQRLPAEPCPEPELAPKAASEPRKGS
jgi:hypothetical protein